MSAARDLVPVADEPQPLRGDGMRPRCLSDKRTAARDIETPILRRVLADAGITNASLTAMLGCSGDRMGAQVRAGASPITSGEVATLLPLPVAGRCFLELLEHRIDSELVKDPSLVRLQLAKSHLAALFVLLGTTE